MQRPKLCFTWDIDLCIQLHEHCFLLCDLFCRAEQGVLWVWEIWELTCACTLECMHELRALRRRITVVFLESFRVPHWKKTWQKYGILTVNVCFFVRICSYPQRNEVIYLICPAASHSYLWMVGNKTGSMNSLATCGFERRVRLHTSVRIE